jgi:Sjoegren syndrome nuclear autoantigen 1
MSAQGATLQNYNNELVRCLEDLREKRELLNKTIVAEEKKKADIQRKLEKLTSQVRGKPQLHAPLLQLEHSG